MTPAAERKRKKRVNRGKEFCSDKTHTHTHTTRLEFMKEMGVVYVYV
jgi:hypothetical protein